MKPTSDAVELLCALLIWKHSRAVQHRCSLPHFSSSPPSPVPNLCFSAVGEGFVDREIIA